jgi:hypothetical protein
MKKLLELQNQYIEELKQFVTDAVDLLKAAKYAAGNNISDCTVKDCTAEERCNFCKAWAKVWDDIDKYLEGNE